jgi:undecaprenyl-diphosphatase
MLIAEASQYTLFAVLACAAVVWLTLGQRERGAMLVALVLAVVVGGGLLLASAVAWYDPRPFVVDGTSPLFPHSPDNGFPSDHTVAATLVAGVVMGFRLRTGLALLLASILLGAARVAAQVHHVPDIVAGVLIGLTAAAVGVTLAHAAIGSWAGWRLPWHRADPRPG